MQFLVHLMGIAPKDNSVDMATSEGPLSALVICCLLHLRMNLVLVPPQLSCPTWTGMRQGTDPVQVIHSFYHFVCPLPTHQSPEINTQQLGLMGGLYVPEPAVMLTLANQLDNLRAAPPEPKVGNLESREGDGTKDKTPKKVKPVDTSPA